MVIFLFSAYFRGHSCYHSNDKSQFNADFNNWTFVLINLPEEVGEKQLLFFVLIGGWGGEIAPYYGP